MSVSPLFLCRNHSVFGDENSHVSKLCGFSVSVSVSVSPNLLLTYEQQDPLCFIKTKI